MLSSEEVLVRNVFRSERLMLSTCATAAGLVAVQVDLLLTVEAVALPGTVVQEEAVAAAFTAAVEQRGLKAAVRR